MKILVCNSKGGCGKTTLVLALADILNAKVVDLDPQRTITSCSEFTGRHKPVSENEMSNYENVIVDTPPYNDIKTANYFPFADYILIPCKLSQADLMATRAIYNTLIAKKAEKKSFIVFNERTNPDTLNQKKVRNYFIKNFPKVQILKNSLTNLKEYRDILETNLLASSKPYNQVKKLVEELAKTASLKGVFMG